MTLLKPIAHDADLIRRLQNAHADHIESMYAGLARAPGNPDGVFIERVGPARVFIASGERFTNRLILAGTETRDEFDAIFSLYDLHRAGCVVEINPANFYPDAPKDWSSDIVPELFRRGCELRHFRCVWVRRSGAVLPRFRKGRALSFDHDRTADYLPYAREAQPGEDWPAFGERLLAAESGPGWHHYVALMDGKAVATAAFFKAGATGYLAQADTHPDHRRKGAHALLIERRVLHAKVLGCDLVFSVTDSHTQSARDLQRRGFSLAYNYLLFTRPAKAD